jgi:hypothetical protein
MRFAWVASLCLLLEEHGNACSVRLLMDPYMDFDAEEVESDVGDVVEMLHARCSRVQLTWDWG